LQGEIETAISCTGEDIIVVEETTILPEKDVAFEFDNKVVCRGGRVLVEEKVVSVDLQSSGVAFKSTDRFDADANDEGAT